MGLDDDSSGRAAPARVPPEAFRGGVRAASRVLATAAIAGILVVCGCRRAPAPSWAIDTVRPVDEEEGSVRWRLDEDRQGEAKRILRSVAADHEPVDPPGPAAAGVRLSDVPAALRQAVIDVEMAVVRRTETADGYDVVLRTVEDWPARLTVRRTGDATVYRAEATVGRYGDHVERAEALVAALDRWLRAYGRKRKIASER